MPSLQVNSRQSSLRFSAFVNGRMDHHPTVKRWDGAARTCTEWDNIRRVSRSRITHETEYLITETGP